MWTHSLNNNYLATPIHYEIKVDLRLKFSKGLKTGFRRAPLRSGQIFDVLLPKSSRINKKNLLLEFPAVFE